MRKQRKTPREIRKYRVKHNRRRQTLRTPEELKQIALGLHKNDIFTNKHCHSSREVQMCFPILGFLDKATAARVAFQAGRRGLIYEYMKHAAPRAINGLPMFFSMKILTSGETTIVNEKFKRLQEMEAAV